MRKLLIIAIFVFLLLPFKVSALDLSAITYPELKEIHEPEVEKIVLPNGLRLYILEDDTLPLFKASVRINGGSYLESADQIGLSDITADLLKAGGTKKWSPDALDELIEKHAANLKISSGIVSCGMSIDIMSRHTELAVEVIAELLRRPAFDESRFEQLMLQYKSAIDRRNDDINEAANREFDKLIYGKDSVYARHIEYSTLKNINTDEIRKFYNLLYRPENIQISLYGDFKSAEIKKLIVKYFGDWKKGEKPLPPLPEVKYTDSKKLVVIDVPGSKQTGIFMGHLGGRRSDADYPHQIMMNNIFCELSFSSRLFKEIRTKLGLCYSIYGSYASTFTYPGAFFIFTATRTERTVEAISNIIDEIRKMQETNPTEEELEVAKKSYLNRFVFNYEDRRDVLARLMIYDAYGMPSDFLEKTRKAVEKTTADDVHNAALKNLRPDALRIVIIGDKSKFIKELEELNYAPIEEIDITIKK